MARKTSIGAIVRREPVQYFMRDSYSARFKVLFGEIKPDGTFSYDVPAGIPYVRDLMISTHVFTDCALCHTAIELVYQNASRVDLMTAIKMTATLKKAFKVQDQSSCDQTPEGEVVRFIKALGVKEVFLEEGGRGMSLEAALVHVREMLATMKSEVDLAGARANG